MRKLVIAGVALCACAPFVGAAEAGVKVRTVEKTYSIAGATGDQLLTEMDRKGPKHGFLTRAIAQTRYVVSWDIAWSAERGGCRVDQVEAKLDVTYTFPRVSTRMTPALRKRWDTFLSGVRKHERVHGIVARRMVEAAERSVSGVAVKRDPNCRLARAEVKRRVDAAYRKYEAQQHRFDDVEHRDGGNVARLVDRLTR